SPSGGTVSTSAEETARRSHAKGNVARVTRVAITGVGAVSPLGLDAKETWRAACAGESGIGWISTFDTDGLPVRVAGEVKGFHTTTVVPPHEARKLSHTDSLG